MRIPNIGASKLSSNQDKNRNKNNQNIVQQSGFNTKQGFTGFKLQGSFVDPTFSWAEAFLYKFSNKLTAIILEKPKTELTFLSTRVNTGALNEPETHRGISHLKEHTVFLESKGEEPGYFDKMCAKYGAHENAYTSYSNTSYMTGTASNSPKELQPLIGSYANMIINPTFPINPLEKEKGVVIQEIKKYQNDPVNLLSETSLKALFGVESDSEDIILGTEENIRNITRGDLIRHHKDFYAPNNTQILAVTGMHHEKMAELIDKNFVTPDFMPSETSNFFTPTNLLEKTRMDFLRSSLVNIDSVKIAFAGPRNANTKELIATDALLKIMGGNSFSRLSRNLLKFDAAPSVNLDFLSNNPFMPQKITFEMDSRHRNLQSVLDGFRRTVDELKTNPIKQEELDMAKKGLLLNFYSNAQSVDDFAYQFEQLTPLMDTSSYQNYLKIVKSLTLEDVNAAADKYIMLDKASVTILHPEKTDASGISFMGKEKVATEGIEKILLPNNVKLVIKEDARKFQSFVVANLEASSLAHAKPGVAEILAQLLENSTAKNSEEKLSYLKALNGLDDLQLEAENFGISAHSVSLTEDLLTSVKLIREMFFEPKINKKNFNKAKNEVSLDLGAELLHANDRAYEAMYGKHPEGITIRLLTESIDKVKFEDVQKYYERLMKNARLNVVVSGPISQIKGLKDEIIKELSQINKTFNKNKLNETKFQLPNDNKVVVQTKDDLASSEIIQLFHTDTKTPKELAVINVLDGILGGGGFSARLFDDLRVKQELAYSVGSGFTQKDNFGQEFLEITTGLTDKNANLNDNIEKSIYGFAKHIKLLMDEAPSEIEISNVKRAIITQKKMSADNVSLSGSNLLYGLKNGLGVDFEDALMDEIKKVTPKDVQEAAKKYFSQPSVISILTTKEAAEKSQKFLEKFGDLKIYDKE